MEEKDNFRGFKKFIFCEQMIKDLKSSIKNLEDNENIIIPQTCYLIDNCNKYLNSKDKEYVENIVYNIFIEKNEKII